MIEQAFMEVKKDVQVAFPLGIIIAIVMVYVDYTTMNHHDLVMAFIVAFIYAIAWFLCCIVIIAGIRFIIAVISFAVAMTGGGNAPKLKKASKTAPVKHDSSISDSLDL